MDNNELRLKKQEEYMEYIKTHIENVKKAFNHMIDTTNQFGSTNRELQLAMQDIIDRKIIQNHDNSKFSDEEFEPYRKYFYSINDIEKNNEEEFEEAWRHHYMNNNHHPEYWENEDGTYDEMSMIAIVEMVCDWEAMAYVFGGSAAEYYQKNKAEKDAIMHPNTISKLESIFKIFN